MPPPRAVARFEFSEVRMGMPVRIVLYAPALPAAETAARTAFARIAALDAMLSDYRPDSELNRLATWPDEWVPVSRELFDVLELAMRVAKASDGAFDPTIGPLTLLWREARRAGSRPSSMAIEEARVRVGWQFLGLDATSRRVRLARAGMRLDLGGIAKGFILQQALAVLDSQGIHAALLEAGGDIVAGDAPPGRAGWDIATPYAATDTAFARRAAALTRAALATSGPVAQYLEADGVRYSHVIDPRTGIGVTSSRITAVIAQDAALADALATALGVLDGHGAGRLLPRFPDAVAMR